MPDLSTAASFLAAYAAASDTSDIDPCSVVEAMALLGAPDSFGAAHSLVRIAGARLVEEGHGALLHSAGYEPSTFADAEGE